MANMNITRCFHKDITGVEAAHLLMEKGRDGSFLCRPSGSARNDYSLSVRKNDKVTNIKIQNHGHYFDLCGGESFPTLHDLIRHYQDNGGLPEKNGEFIQLLYPMNCKDATNERWFHGHMTGQDAQNLLMEKGKNGSYLVRESVSQIGDYVISIRSDDHVRHVMMRCLDGKFDVGGEPTFPTMSALVDFYSQNPMVVENDSTILHLKLPLNTTTFTVSAIADRIAELHKINVTTGKDGFWEEHEQLQQQSARLRKNKKKIGMNSENKKKNRFPNIVPFDDSRVILQCEEDYINASYIKAEGECKCGYIATQGCLPETMFHFWKMVHQENSRLILMLNPQFEKGKERCAKYWPELDSSMTVGDFIIRNLKERTTQEFTSRELELTSRNDALLQPRIIYQYQYVAWPETGHPDNVDFVLGILHDISLRQAKDCADAGPLVVHCSNGVGRTASMIVIDMLVKRLQREGYECEVDIQRAVQHVRTQRFDQMVQLEVQYKFIYLAIAHHVEMEWNLPRTEVQTKPATTSPAKCKKPDIPSPLKPPPRQIPLPRDPEVSGSFKLSPPPPIVHRLPPKPPTIAINGTIPPPIPQRKPGGEQSMCSVFSKPSHAEDPPLPDTPPPVPERKKVN